MKRRTYFRSRAFAGLSVIATTTLFGIASATAAYQISNGTIASGGGIVSNACFSLSSTIGEPVAGNASANDTYTLTAGFQATTANQTRADSIFKNGFDNQPKDCSP